MYIWFDDRCKCFYQTGCLLDTVLLAGHSSRQPARQRPEMSWWSKDIAYVCRSCYITEHMFLKCRVHVQGAYTRAGALVSVQAAHELGNWTEGDSHRSMCRWRAGFHAFDAFACPPNVKNRICNTQFAQIEEHTCVLENNFATSWTDCRCNVVNCASWTEESVL